MADENTTPAPAPVEKVKTIKVSTNPKKVKDLAMTFYDGSQKEGSRNIGGFTIDKKTSEKTRKVVTVELNQFIQKLLYSEQIIEV